MKILLAIDASAASQIVIQEVGARPWPAGTVAYVLSVADEADDEAVRQLSELTERAVEQLIAAGVDATPLTLTGDPKSVILDQAAEVNADLIFVGSHGDSALKRFLLGSVAAAVIRFAPCSIEVVRRTIAKGSPIKVL